MRKTTSIAVIGLFGFLVCLAAAAEKTKAAKNNLKPADIFRGTNIWTVRLTFTPEQWKAMEPRQGPPPARPPGANGFSLQGPEGGRNGMMAAFGLIFDYVLPIWSSAPTCSRTWAFATKATEHFSVPKTL